MYLGSHGSFLTHAREEPKVESSLNTVFLEDLAIVSAQATICSCLEYCTDFLPGLVCLSPCSSCSQSDCTTAPVIPLPCSQPPNGSQSHAEETPETLRELLRLSLWGLLTCLLPSSPAPASSHPLQPRQPPCCSSDALKPAPVWDLFVSFSLRLQYSSPPYLHGFPCLLLLSVSAHLSPPQPFSSRQIFLLPPALTLCFPWFVCFSCPCHLLTDDVIVFKKLLIVFFPATRIETPRHTIFVCFVAVKSQGLDQ